MGYLNVIDKKFDSVDVTDDYYSHLSGLCEGSHELRLGFSSEDTP